MSQSERKREIARRRRRKEAAQKLAKKQGILAAQAAKAKAGADA